MEDLEKPLLLSTSQKRTDHVYFDMESTDEAKLWLQEVFADTEKQSCKVLSLFTRKDTVSLLS
jgi:hypothetical protein